MSVGDGSVGVGFGVITGSGATERVTGFRVKIVWVSTGAIMGAVEGVTEVIDGASESTSTGGAVTGASESMEHVGLITDTGAADATIGVVEGLTEVVDGASEPMSTGESVELVGSSTDDGASGSHVIRPGAADGVTEVIDGASESTSTGGAVTGASESG